MGSGINHALIGSDSFCRELLALYQTAVLHHDEPGQETLLNLLLRNYLHYNLYDQVRPCVLSLRVLFPTIFEFRTVIAFAFESELWQISNLPNSPTALVLCAQVLQLKPC